VTWIELVCWFLACFVSGGLAVHAGAVLIPNSLAEMENPPDPYWGG
jgi:hypothetical protein